MVIAIVLAAGNGKRMNSDVAKQYIKLFDKEIVVYPLETFQNNKLVDKIIIVTREEDIEYCKNELVSRYNLSKVSDVISGGKERYDSVYQALCLIEEKYIEGYNVEDEVGDGILDKFDKNPIIVMIHDGARPFVSDQMIEQSVKAAKEFGACTVGVPVKDTIKIIDDDYFGIDTPERKKLYQIQTPQTFSFDILKQAHDRFRESDNHKITDDTMLIEQYKGIRCKVLMGAYENIKVTTPDDLEVAECYAKKYLKKNEKMC